MKITCLVENTSNCSLKPVHGLSLYIETKNHKILFDLGPDETLFNNAKLLNIDLKNIDTVIISHGHHDHGGALEQFLNVNNTANIYIQQSAFKNHTNKSPKDHSISIDKSLMTNNQIVLLNGNYKIDEELQLFTVNSNDMYHSYMNDSLYEDNHIDSFEHEQNLLIRENKNVLIMGCGHKGIVNILNNVHIGLDYCIGGYHLYNRRLNETVDDSLLIRISDELNKYPNILFYTCHCTGKYAYEFLRKRMKNMNYLSCGDILNIK